VNDETMVSVETVRSVIAEREGYYMDRPELMLNAENRVRVSPGKGPRHATLKCPKCNTHVRVYEDEAGTTGICPGCDAPVKVPADVFETARRRLRRSATPQRRRETTNSAPGPTRLRSSRPNYGPVGRSLSRSDPIRDF